MKNTIVYFLLLFISLFFSCNMGRHYANMRASHHDADREENILAEEKTKSGSFSVIKTDSVYSYPTSMADFPENNATFYDKSDPVQKNKTNVVFEQPTLSIEANQNKKIQESISGMNPSKKAIGYSDGFPRAVIFLIFVLPILVALSVFLISWIFVAASIALRIALWTLAGIIVFELVLTILDSIKG